MARKPFKFVTDVDLSGNSLIDVLSIVRENYEDNALRSLTIASGSDPDTGTAPDSIGGDLNLISGTGFDNDNFGSILIRAGLEFDPATALPATGSGLASIDITPAGITTTTYNDTAITLDAGTGSTIITSTTNSTGVGTGALQVSGGAYIAGDLITGSSSFDSSAASYDLLPSPTTITFASSAESLIMGANTATTTIEFPTTKDATTPTDAGVEIAGGLGVALQLRVGTNTELGLADTNTTTIRGSLLVPDSALAAPITLGGDVNIYRDAADSLVIDSETTTIEGTTLRVPNVLETINTSAADLFSQSTDINLGSSNSGTNTFTLESDRVEIEGTIAYLRFFEDPVAESYTVPTTVGTVSYDPTYGALQYATDTAGIDVRIGQERVIRVLNDSTTNTDANQVESGEVVFIAGVSTGGIPHIRRAIADGTDIGITRAIGIVIRPIAADAEGYVVAEGIVTEIDTGTAAVGDPLYLSAGTAGALTTTDPGTIDDDNYTIEIGQVIAIDTLGGPTYDGVIAVNARLPIGATAAFNDLRARRLLALQQLRVPQYSKPGVVTTTEGFLAWDDNNDLLTIGNGTVAKVVVDTDTNQALTNKTYEGLNVTTTTGTLTIANSTTVDAQVNLTVTTAPVTLQGTTNSTLVLPNGTLTLNNLTTDHALFVSATDTISSEPQLDPIRGGTGIGTYAVLDLLYADTTTTLARLPAGTAQQLLTLNDAGDAFLYRSLASLTTALIIGYNGVSGNIEFDLAQPLGPGDDATFGDLTLNGDLAVNGGDITSTATTFNFLTGTVTTLNMLQANNAVLNIGTTTDTQTVNIYANMVIGDPAQEVTVDHYGQFNFGGPTGFTIEWNAGDNSLDFIKL